MSDTSLAQKEEVELVDFLQFAATATKQVGPLRPRIPPPIRLLPVWWPRRSCTNLAAGILSMAPPRTAAAQIETKPPLMNQAAARRSVPMPVFVATKTCKQPLMITFI